MNILCVYTTVAQSQLGLIFFREINTFVNFNMLLTVECPLTLRLAIGMVNVDVHGPVQGADKGGLIGTQSFMSSVDGLCLPVGPVDVFLKQSHGKDVGDVLSKNCRVPDKGSGERCI